MHIKPTLSSLTVNLLAYRRKHIPDTKDVSVVHSPYPVREILVMWTTITLCACIHCVWRFVFSCKNKCSLRFCCKYVYFIRYKQEFGFTIPDRSIIVDDVRVRGKGRAACQNLTPLPEAQTPPTPLEVSVVCV